MDNLKGEIFSNSKLEYFLEEEIRHDHFEISLQNNNRLSFSSSGEQRKAVLKYIIEKKPDYLIIDNVFDSLDQVTRGVILSTLIQLESTTLIIQLFNRRDELLPFIENVYSVHTLLANQCSIIYYRTFLYWIYPNKYFNHNYNCNQITCY